MEKYLRFYSRLLFSHCSMPTLRKASSHLWQGIVFAYVALEYGFQWAVAFHMMNNFLFAVVVDIYLAQMVNFGNFSLVQLLDLIGFVVLVLVVILKWKDIKNISV